MMSMSCHLCTMVGSFAAILWSLRDASAKRQDVHHDARQDRLEVLPAEAPHSSGDRSRSDDRSIVGQHARIRASRDELIRYSSPRADSLSAPKRVRTVVRKAARLVAHFRPGGAAESRSRSRRCCRRANITRATSRIAARTPKVTRLLIIELNSIKYRGTPSCSGSCEFYHLADKVRPPNPGWRPAGRSERRLSRSEPRSDVNPSPRIAGAPFFLLQRPALHIRRPRLSSALLLDP